VLLSLHQYNVDVLPSHPKACCRQKQEAAAWSVFEPVVTNTIDTIDSFIIEELQGFLSNDII